jgi:type VI protein secretion system component VasF
MHGEFATSFAAASHVGWWVITGCGVVVLVLGYLSSGARARASAAQVSATMTPTRPVSVAVGD